MFAMPWSQTKPEGKFNKYISRVRKIEFSLIPCETLSYHYWERFSVGCHSGKVIRRLISFCFTVVPDCLAKPAPISQPGKSLIGLWSCLRLLSLAGLIAFGFGFTIRDWELFYCISSITIKMIEINVSLFNSITIYVFGIHFRFKTKKGLQWVS